NVDPTKLKRAAFIGAASAYFLANVKSTDAPAILRVLQSNGLRRTSTMRALRAALPGDEAANLTRFHLWRERALVDSMDRFFRIPEATSSDATTFVSNIERLVGEIKPASASQGDGRIVFRRNAKLKG